MKEMKIQKFLKRKILKSLLLERENFENEIEKIIKDKMKKEIKKTKKDVKKNVADHVLKNV